MKQWLVATAFASLTTAALAAPTTTTTAPAPAAKISIPKDAKPSPPSDEVNLAQMRLLVATHNALVFDANSAETYKDGHIPGAVSFTSLVKDNKLVAMLPKSRQALIVAYCGGPLCGAWQDAAKKLKELGYTNIHHFKDGLKGWKDAGQPLEKGA
jgi:rhodanese-related sulfurtransferase